MSRSDLNALRALGLYVHEGFLSPIACRQLRRDVQAGAAEAATIIGDGGDVIVDQTVRRAESFDINDAGLRKDVSRHFDSLLPGLAAHYGVALSGYEAPYVVRYPTGGFYRPHTECHGSPETSHRKVSCVVFLNGAGPAAHWRSSDLRIVPTARPARRSFIPSPTSSWLSDPGFAMRCCR
jgi:hypothetical protein